MKKAKNTQDEIRSEYTSQDLGKGERGKFLASYQQGTNLVLLDPEIAKAFPSSQAVNEALSSLINSTENTQKLAARRSPTR